MACGLERGPHAVRMVCAVSSGQTWPREAKLAQCGGAAKGRRAVSRGRPGRAGFVDAVRWGASLFPASPFTPPAYLITRSSPRPGAQEAAVKAGEACGGGGRR